MEHSASRGEGRIFLISGQGNEQEKQTIVGYISVSRGPQRFVEDSFGVLELERVVCVLDSSNIREGGAHKNE